MELHHKLMLVWLGFMLTVGTLEAIYFNKKKSYVRLWKRNIHVWFTVVRICVAAPIVAIITLNVFPVDGLWTSVGVAVMFSAIMVFSFPFFHDGMYYTVRELLHKGTYPLVWLDQSKETDAKNSYNIIIRLIGLIVALMLYPW